MWLMLQRDTPDDYVIATGQSHTIRDLLDTAFSRVGLNWQEHVKVDNRFRRPADPCQLLGNPAKAVNELGWERSVDFSGLIGLMVDHDAESISNRSSSVN